MFFYVLKLANGKYYVGKTKNVERRIQDHEDGYGCEWTKRYKMKSVECVFESDDPMYEDYLVKQLMNHHGISNVRGGSYVQLKLPREQYMAIRRELNAANDKCFRCGGDHFISECITKESIIDDCNNKSTKDIKITFNMILDDCYAIGSKIWKYVRNK